MRVVAALMLVACAPSMLAPVAMPASVPVVATGLADIAEIQVDRCTPPLVGVYMSHQALADVLSGFEIEKGELRVSLAREATKAAIANEQAEAARRRTQEVEASASSWWSRYAFPIGFGGGALLVALAVFGLSYTNVGK